MFTTDSSLRWQINLWDMMTKKEKLIALAFGWYYKLERDGEHETSYFSRKAIAKLAKCSVKSVSRFIRKYKIFCFEAIWQKKGLTPKGDNIYHPNDYKFFEPFFEAMCFLKENGWAKNWSRTREKFLSKLNEDEDLAKKDFGYNRWLMNKQMSRGNRPKCPTKDLRVSSKPFRNNVPTNQDPVPNMGYRKRAASEFLDCPGLKFSDSTKVIFDRFGTPFIAQEINRDYQFNQKHSNIIRYPNGWIKSRLAAQMHHQYKVLKKTIGIR
jgi:hypothetical protein